MAINNSTNAALLAVRILATSSPRLSKLYAEYVQGMEDEVLVKVDKLEEIGADDYVKQVLKK